MIRVALIDDHPLVRAGLAALLNTLGDVEVAGEGSDGAEALEVVERSSPDLLLMDVSMPGVDGIEATRRVRQRHPGLPVLVLTSSRDPEQLRAALAAGAAGYLLKDAEPDEIAAAIRGAAVGRSPIDPRVARALFPTVVAAEPAAARPPAAVVRGREAEVLRLVARGCANKQIAAELGIAERTVKVHLSSVFRRIGVSDRTSAALWARENGY
jgi:DNA-binding NarL/FixJ family response regulator